MMNKKKAIYILESKRRMAVTDLSLCRDEHLMYANGHIPSQVNQRENLLIDEIEMYDYVLYALKKEDEDGY